MRAVRRPELFGGGGMLALHRWRHEATISLLSKFPFIHLFVHSFVRLRKLFRIVFRVETGS